MTTKAHSLLTGTDLHESKGVSTATVGTVYVADGVGSGTWKLYAVPYLCVRDEQTSGTGPQHVSSSGVSTTRTLNTVQSNTITGASLSSNLITLPVGTYQINASAPAVGGQTNHQAYLFNNTDSTTIIVGTSEFSPGTSSPVTRSHIAGQFTLGGTKTLAIKHYLVQGNRDLGSAVGGPNNEVYTIVSIWKVG